MSAGDFVSSLRSLRSAAVDLVPESPSSRACGSMTTRHCVYQIHLCYTHKIHYIIKWHVLSIIVSVYIYERPIRVEMELERNRRSTWRR